MSLSAHETEIYERFDSEWNSDAIRTLYDNAPEEDDDGTNYVRFSVRWGASRKLEFGVDASYETQGRIILQIFTKRGTGTGDATSLSDTFEAIFHEWSNADYSIRTRLAENSTVPNSQWHQVNVSIPFTARHGGWTPTPDVWSPNDLVEDLLAWWDAEDPETMIMDGTSVISWADKVTGLSPSQGNGAFRPALDALGLNNRPAIVLDGTDDYLEWTSGLPGTFPTGASPGEIWVLTSQQHISTTTGGKALVEYGGTGSNRRGIRRNVAASTNRAGFIVNGTQANNLSSDFSGVHVMRLETTATETRLSLDGGSKAVASVVPATAATHLAIGRLISTGDTFYRGAINTILITSPLSDDDATAMTAFLKERGGLT